MDWNIVLDYALKGVGSVVGTLLITYASILFTKLKNKIGEAKLYAYADQCVKAAEQLFPNLGQKTGKEKYEYVKEALLKKYPKLKDNPYLQTVIEAAVYKISQGIKENVKTDKESGLSSF